MRNGAVSFLIFGKESGRAYGAGAERATLRVYVLAPITTPCPVCPRAA